MKNLTLRKIIRFLASLKLAVITMTLISILVAIGTVVESRYDAEAAQKLVYRTGWMWATMILLAINLTAVMVDRWPWKKKHIPFLFAHVGILMILVGSWMTYRYGVDGSMRIELNKSSRHVVLPDTELMVYESTDGIDWKKIYSQEVDFFLNPPETDKPYKVTVSGLEVEVLEYHPYVLPQQKIIASNEVTFGAAVRYQIQNERVTHIEWLTQNSPSETIRQDLGPAQIYLSPVILQDEWGGPRGKNELYLIPQGSDLKYVVFHDDKIKPYRQGVAKEGEEVDLGWMGLKLKILRYYPFSESTWEVTPKERPTPLTTSAIKVRYQGQERWVLLNDSLRILKPGAIARFIYTQKRLPLKFQVHLKNFHIERYQGSNKAAEYSSLVEVPDKGTFQISMNEPMRLSGLLFYQASFEDGPGGQPKATILSVNYDPGRWIKYLGSLIMSLGIILLFYFRKFYQKSN